MENAGYYIFLLVAIIVGITIIKRIASCMVKSLVLVVLLAILAYFYFFVLS